MKILNSFTLLAVSTFALLANALPFSGLQSEPQIVRRKAPYSVVPVDGGKPNGPSSPKTQVITKDSTQTVTESPKTFPPVTETILSTTVVTESETLITIITTITTTSTPITAQIPDPEVSLSISTTFATVTSLVSTADTITITSTPTLTPYDDGSWHTTYYKAAEPSSSSETSSSVTGNETPLSVTDVESIPFAGIPPNGTFALMLRGGNKSTPSNTTATGRIASSVVAAIKTKPPMPTLPKTSEVVNPTEVPTIDVAKHMVPGFGR